MKSSDIAQILIARGKKICDAGDIAGIFNDLDKNKTITKLYNSGWIQNIRPFKGVYYVMNSEEHQNKKPKIDAFTGLIQALNLILRENWYFSRLTALHLLGVINQPPNKYYVINKKYSKSVKVSFFGEITFIRLGANMDKESGIIEKEYNGYVYRISSMERTVADYAYLYYTGSLEKNDLERVTAYAYNRQKAIEIAIKSYSRNQAARIVRAISGD